MKSKTKEEQKMFEDWASGNWTENHKYVEGVGEIWEDVDGWYCIPDCPELGVSGPFPSALEAYASLKRSRKAKLRNKEQETTRDMF